MSDLPQDPTLGDTPDETPAQEAPHKSPDDWQFEARSAGYGWGDINGHIAQASQQAAAAGYTEGDINSYLGYQDPQPARERFAFGFSRLFGSDPKALDGLASSEPSLDLFAGDWRGDYIGALRRNEVKGAEDFTNEYAAAALRAAHTPDHLDASDGDTLQSRVAAGGAAANELAAALPSRADFVDAALSLAPDKLSQSLVKDNLMQYWRDTGKPPVEAALAAQNDGDLMTRLLAGPAAEEMGAAEVSKLMEPAVNAYLEWGAKNQEESFKASRDMMDLMRQGKHAEAAEKLMESPAMGFVGGTIGEGTVGGALAIQNVIDKLGGDAKPLLDALLGKFKVIDPAAPPGEAVRFDPAAAMAPPDALTHLEAQERALEPPKTETSAALEATQEKPKRPSYRFKEVEEPTEAYAENPGHKTFELHRDGEPVGFAEVSFPEDRPGVAVLDNIASDERAGSMGPRAVRDLAKQFFEAHPDVEQLEGFRVSGARIQSGEGAGTMTIMRDQVLKGPKPEEMTQLTEGYKTAGSVLQYLSKTAGDILGDERGSLNLRKIFNTPAQITAQDDRYLGQSFMERHAISEMGLTDQTVAQIAKQLEKHYPTLAPHMDEWNTALDAGPASPIHPMDTTVGNMIDYIQGHSLGASLKSTSDLGLLANLFRNVNLAIEQELRDAESKGLINVGGYYQDYFRQMWKDPNRVDEAVGGGKLGTNGSFKERTYPTWRDGINANLEPAIRDPIQLSLMDIQGKLRYISAAKQIENFRANGYGKWSTSGPPAPGMKPLDGFIARKQFVDSNGNIQNMQFYAQPGVADAWNNMVSKGFFNTHDEESPLANLMRAMNAMTMIKLFDPAFHMQTVGIGNMAGSIGRGIEETYRGQFYDAMKSIFGSPGASVRDFITGAKSTKAFFDPTNPDPIVQTMVKAGFRFDKAGTFYDMSGGGRIPSLYQSISRGTLGMELKNDIGKLWDSGEYTVMRNFARMPKQLMGLVGTELGRVGSLISEPIFKQLIPKLEAGSIYNRYASWLAANPTASEEASWRAMRGYVKDVENRLGELNLDSVFAGPLGNKTRRQIAGSVLMSTSWVYGTFRNLAAAVGWDIEHGGPLGRWSTQEMFTPLASTIGTAVALGFANTVAQYIHTGQLPQSLGDMFNYRTGGTFKPGKSNAQERGMIPSEAKEIFDIGSIFSRAAGDWSRGMLAYGAGLTGGGFTYALGKMNPFWQMVRTGLSGAFNLEAVDPVGHVLAMQPGGYGRFLWDNYKPVFLNALEQAKKGSNLSAFERIMGEKEAPGWVQDWDYTQRGLEGVRQKLQKEAIQRAKKEDAENASPSGYDMPEMPQGGGGGRGGGRGSIGGYQDPRTFGAPATRSRSGARSGGYRDPRL